MTRPAARPADLNLSSQRRRVSSKDGRRAKRQVERRRAQPAEIGQFGYLRAERWPAQHGGGMSRSRGATVPASRLRPAENESSPLRFHGAVRPRRLRSAVTPRAPFSTPRVRRRRAPYLSSQCCSAFAVYPPPSSRPPAAPGPVEDRVAVAELSRAGPGPGPQIRLSESTLDHSIPATRTDL